jgi:hypothetical protein
MHQTFRSKHRTGCSCNFDRTTGCPATISVGACSRASVLTTTLPHASAIL